MITHSALYWITRLDALKSMFCGFSISIGIIGVFLLIVGIIFKAIYIDNMSSTTEENADKLHEKYMTRHAWMFRNGVKLIVCTFILICVYTLTPTMKEMAVIAVIPKVANSQPVQDLGEGVVNLAKDWMKELSPSRVSKDELANKTVDAADTVVKTAKTVNVIVSKGSAEKSEVK